MRAYDLIEYLTKNCYDKGVNPEIRIQVPGGKGNLGIKAGDGDWPHIKRVGNVVYIGLDPKDHDERRVFLGD